MSRYIPDTLRAYVAQRAEYCCEYCRLPEADAFFAYQIDHIISVKHGGSSASDNLAYACVLCNNTKGSDIGTVLLPQKLFIRLFNPREDEWEAHFDIMQGIIQPKTEIGEATIKVLQLNALDRIIERREAGL